MLGILISNFRAEAVEIYSEPRVKVVVADKYTKLKLSDADLR